MISAAETNQSKGIKQIMQLSYLKQILAVVICHYANFFFGGGGGRGGDLKKKILFLVVCGHNSLNCGQDARGNMGLSSCFTPSCFCRGTGIDQTPRKW